MVSRSNDHGGFNTGIELKSEVHEMKPNDPQVKEYNDQKKKLFALGNALLEAINATDEELEFEYDEFRETFDYDDNPAYNGDIALGILINREQREQIEGAR